MARNVGQGNTRFLGITALGTYSVGRQSAPVSSAPVATVSAPASTGAKSVAFVGLTARAPAGVQPSTSSGGSPPPLKDERARVVS